MSEQFRPLLDTADAARIFNVSTATVRRWRRAGKLRAVLIGRELRFDPAEVERLLSAALEAPGPIEVRDRTVGGDR